MLAIVGGSGLYTPGDDFSADARRPRSTPYGDTSAEIVTGAWQGRRLAFLARHGSAHEIPPHRVNYRANIHALNELGVKQVIAVNAVGGITAAMAPRTLVLPDQIVDYSSGRDLSFFDGGDSGVAHVDFTEPYNARLRDLLRRAAAKAGQAIVDGATYACTNGPRFETAAEIRRLRNDGCDIVGMTAMPEAILARELGIDYAAVALVVNWAAGVDGQLAALEEIMANLEQGMERVRPLLLAAVTELGQ